MRALVADARDLAQGAVAVSGHFSRGARPGSPGIPWPSSTARVADAERAEALAAGSRAAAQEGSRTLLAPVRPEIIGDGVQYDGYRFRAECRRAGQVCGARFGADVAYGGVLTGEVEEITTDDLLGFAGIAPPRLRVVPIETHLAEKLTRTRCRAIGPTPE